MIKNYMIGLGVCIGGILLTIFTFYIAWVGIFGWHISTPPLAILGCIGIVAGIVLMWEATKNRNLSVSDTEAVRKLEELRQQTQEFNKSLDKKKK